MICKKCGNIVNENMNICSVCGNSINSEIEVLDNNNAFTNVNVNNQSQGNFENLNQNNSSNANQISNENNNVLNVVNNNQEINSSINSVSNVNLQNDVNVGVQSNENSNSQNINVKTNEVITNSADFEKIKKMLASDMKLLCILSAFLTIVSFFIKFNIFQLIYTIFLFIGWSMANDGKKSAGTIGIIVGILMILTILTGSVIDMLLGIFLLIRSIKYKIFFKKYNKNN